MQEDDPFLLERHSANHLVGCKAASAAATPPMPNHGTTNGTGGLTVPS